MSPRRKRYLYNIGGISLSALFIYFCFHFLKGQNVSNVFAIPYPWYFFLVVILNLPLMGLHTYSWKTLLVPIKRLPFWTLFDILHMGYMGNNLLPLKAGEFFRSSFIAKKWSLPYTRVLTTVGLERFFAGISLLILFLLVTFWLALPVWLKTSAYTLLAILLAVQIWLWILWTKKPNVDSWQSRHPVIYHFIKTMDHIEEGSAVLKDPKMFLWLVLVGLTTWGCQALMLRLCQMAYGISLSWPATIFVLVAINLAIVLPSAPGNIGTFQLAAILAYNFVGIDRATGLGIGIFFHILQVLPTTLIGLFYFWRWGIRFKDMERVAEDQLEEVLP
jgi:glycosyltransferase 2 family protein